MKSIQTHDLIRFLTSLGAKDFKNGMVDDYLSESRFEEDAFLPFIHFREDTYGRNLVFKNRFFELLVLTWLPEQRTKIHDHSKQKCWVLIDSGELTVKNFEMPTEPKQSLKPLGKAETWKAGSRIYIDDGIGIHTMANASKKPTVTVHLYAGPISHCRTYNEQTRRFEEVELFYLTEGVWTPEMELIESRICDPLAL